MSAPTNSARAAWADEALRTFEERTGCDREDSLCDLLADLIHWADRNALDFTAQLARARYHYDAERREEAGL